MDLANMIKTIADLGEAKRKRYEVTKIGDRNYLLDHEAGTSTEVMPRFEDIAAKPLPVTVRDLESLIEWARGCATIVRPEGLGQLIPIDDENLDEPPISGAIIPGTPMSINGPPGIVVVSAGAGPTRATWPIAAPKHQARVESTAAFFNEYVKDIGDWMDLVDFIAWLDKIRPFINQSQIQALDLALKTVTGSESVGKTIAQSGGSISVQTVAEKKAEQANPFPKEIEAEIPYGDPAFKAKAKFSLTLKAEHGELEVRAVAAPEPMTSEYIAWAREKLSALPGGWKVLVGP